MANTFVLRVDRQLFGNVCIPAGTIVRESFKPHYGLKNDDEYFTGKPHSWVEPVNAEAFSIPAFTVPTQDLIPL